jgi:hypothetical protein
MKLMIQFLIKWSCLVGFFGLSACAYQVALRSADGGKNPREVLAERVRSRHVLSVLFVGNSYSFGMPKAFSKVAALHGKKVRIGHSTFSGWSLECHAAYPPTLQKIREGDWDIVVIQEQSGIPALPKLSRDAKMFPPLRKLVATVRQSGAIPILYQTWGRRDGLKSFWHHDNFYAMNARIRAGYKAAAANASGLIVVPAGNAWERETKAGRGNKLFLADGSHPSEFGNTVTAEVFYDIIFGR